VVTVVTVVTVAFFSGQFAFFIFTVVWVTLKSFQERFRLYVGEFGLLIFEIEICKSLQN
jgi:hypothetical protein